MPDFDKGVLGAFTDAAPLPPMRVADERRLLRVNARWCALTGYESDAARDMRIDDLLAPESRPGIDMRWSDLLGAGLSTARIVILRPDHSRLAVRYGAFANVVAGIH